MASLKDCKFASVPTGDPDFQIQMTNLATDITTAVQDLCGVLPIDDLHVPFKRVFSLVWSPQQWLSVFGRCKALKDVLITGDDVLPFSHALLFHTDLDNVADSRQRRSGGRILRRDHVFLPNLQSLTFRDFSFDMRSSQGHTFLALLEKWLRARKRIDAAPRLRLEDARSFSREDIARFRTLVEVETDREHEGDLEDEDEDEDGVYDSDDDSD
ncbi:hypothetical protein EWM64_g6614 [Hericium alpestre]|uniref:F-box domain-containing protein n=1 Tax=Hericium alpestre TaxID=135208 RepID=A0A4Y9ZTM0_9AGAM|nr:hypothetical protein EWM64_g6614 [Hericium alpestre]